MSILLEYIRLNYVTLMLLSGLIAILFANRRTKIEGVEFVWAIIGLVMVLTICEYLEFWCDEYNKSIWILYLKAALTNSINPLLILLELFLITPIKKSVVAFDAICY